ncbi:MAG: hypothetical protein JO041_14815 [Acidobacteria bacterium]|nr:hypothetical protein [Acidobacteriota bacterium]
MKRTKPIRALEDRLAARRRRKPWLSFVLLTLVLVLWYKYWIPPAADWLWHAIYGKSVGWHGRAIAVPKDWYAAWPNGRPELHHFAVPLTRDATVAIRTGSEGRVAVTYDYFRAHSAEVAANSGFGIQTIRTFVRGPNQAFCIQGYNGAGMNEECAFTNADFALLVYGAPAAERDFDAIVRSVLQ